MTKIPPRNGEGDRAQRGGGGVKPLLRPEVTAARTLRREMTLPEILLWQRLRASKTGAKFRRQDPIGPYVVDFCCREARLIVEVDGEAHNRGDRPAHDMTRDVFLTENGYRVIRLAATDVLRDADGAASSIAALVASPLHRPADGPPPRAGEELR